ncbi:MAG: thioredoxin-like domain-containing protein [Fuerstiella sp.]|nr:thioredoxin-like domain-containing protein [Fuerstiella sp.]
MNRRIFIITLLLLFATVSMQSTAAPDETTPGAAATKQKPQDEKPAPQNPFPDAVAVPPGIMDGGVEWLNTSTPIDLKALRGKVVLLDFWTYCCINCMHVLPDLKYLEEKYPNELVVIGVHSAKFDNEKLSQNIRDAILRYEIKHPVVNDSEMLIWRKFGTRAWPTLALIDPEGKFAGAQGGEGNRELFDTVISKVIEYHRWKGTLDETPVVFDLETNSAKPTALRYPGKIIADQKSNRLFISDSNHNRIVVTDLTGKLLHTIGSGQAGRSDGSFTAAEFDHPQGMALVGETLYVADTENHLLRSVDLQAASVETLAGTGVQGRPRNVHGEVLKTELNSPWSLCHIDGILYIAMAGPHQIWSHAIGSNEIKVHAGTAREDVINGALMESAFAQPSGLSANEDGTLFYVADSEGSAIREVPVDGAGKVSTVAGTSELPRGQSLFAFGDIDATGADARFQHPLGVAWHANTVFVADSYNHKIRRVDLASGEVTTWLGTGTAGENTSPLELNEPAGLSIAGGQLYIADTNNHRICRADLTTKEVTVIKIPELKPPGRKPRRSAPDTQNAIEVPEQIVKLDKSFRILIDLNIPDGHKLNTIAPVTWELFQLDGDSILAPEATAGRADAEVADGRAALTVPLTETAGSGVIVVQVSYAYCSTEKGSVCRLATGTWKTSLTVDAEATGADVGLAFPDAAKGSGR